MDDDTLAELLDTVRRFVRDKLVPLEELLFAWFSLQRVSR